MHLDGRVCPRRDEQKLCVRIAAEGMQVLGMIYDISLRCNSGEARVSEIA